MSKIINNTQVEQFKKDVHRYTLRITKENSRIIYRGDWAREERTIMEANGYKNGDNIERKMFSKLWSLG